MKSKDRHLQIRVTPEEKAAIQAAATRAGVDMSAWVLGRVLPSQRETFQRLTAALARDPERRRFVLAELNDFLTAAAPVPAHLARAVADAPGVALEPYLANYVAAMVETAAHDADITPPSWTSEVAPLDEPVFAAPFAALRLHLLLNSPPAFRRRNIFVDATIGSRV